MDTETNQRCLVDQMSDEMIVPTEDIRKIVEAAFGDYRTIGGICRETGVRRELVERVVESAYFESPELKIGGDPVYFFKGSVKI